MVNLSLGVKESKSRSQLSISPSGHGSPHPTGDRSSLSQQKSPSMKAVQKVVLVEDSTGQDPGYSQRWYEGSGNGGSDQVDLADSALKAVREGSVTATDDGGYFNPENRKKRAAKTKQLVCSRIT